MKVIHLISGGDTGGAKTHVHSLLQGLNQHIQADMICFTGGPFVSEARDLGIRVDVIPGNPLSILKPLKERIQTEGYDLIHCHGARGNLIGALLRRSTGLPVVTTVHSDPKLDYMGRPASRLAFGSANAWALRHIPYRIGVSDAMADLLISRGFSPQQTFVIYNGIDFSADHTPKLSRKEFLAELGVDWPDDTVIAGIAARLNPVKDMGTLLRGFAAAHASQPQLRLIIAGDGPDESMLRQLAAELGVTEQVCFAGWLSDTDSFYNALDINTLTSLSETFSYAITEGARFALPTVSSRVGGIPYLIDHGTNGFLFEPRDHQALGQHLAALAADADLRRRMGQHLLDKARTHYSIESTIQRQLDIYETILRRHARPKGKRDGVVICGAYGQNNAGDEAVLKAVLAELRAIDPDMPLWVMTRKPKETRINCRVGAVYTFNVPAFCRKMSKSRLYVNGGGSLIQDVTSRRSLWFYLFTLAAARRMGCRVIMYGCGIGPVGSARNRRRAARVINRNVEAITLRDSASIDFLRDIGVDKPEMVLAADPAVTLPAAPREVADGLLESAGLKPQEQKYLGITVRPWSGFEDKIPVFAAAAEYAYEKYGLIPVFIPIESRLDTAAAKQVAAAIKTAPHAILPPSSCAEHAIALFSRMDVVLSMRLHALVFAAGHGVPLVGAVYDPKVSSFLDAVGQDLHAPLEDLTPTLLRSLLDRAAARREDRAALEEKASQLLHLEQNNSAFARKLLAK